MTTIKRQAILYYRVSTERQGQSGLGLKAQQSIAKSYCDNNNIEIKKEYTEVKSGKTSDRAKLQKALNECKKTDAILVVATLSRISRDVEFIAQLQKSNVEFICADMPSANKSMIQFMSVFAEYEREMISKRTRDGLAKSDKKLGNKKKTTIKDSDRGREKGTKAIKKRTNDKCKMFSKDMAIAFRYLKLIEKQKRITKKMLLDFFNEQGYKNPIKQAHLSDIKPKKVLFNKQSFSRLFDNCINNNLIKVAYLNRSSIASITLVK